MAKTYLLVGALLTVASSASASAERTMQSSAPQAIGSSMVRASTNSTGAQANGASSGASLSSGGRYVVFVSSASNLVPGGTVGPQVFRKDLQTGAIAVVSANVQNVAGNAASAAPAISPDGRFVAFESIATNLVPGDTAVRDIFLKDMYTKSIRRVSASGSGVPGDGASRSPTVSVNGRYVAFVSEATNLVASGSTGQQVFQKDTSLGGIALVSAATGGAPGNASSSVPSISADGRFVAFASLASNLVPSDSNGVSDIFVRDRTTRAVERASRSAAGIQANGASSAPALSPDGRHVAFVSTATNLAAACRSGVQAILIKRLSSGAVHCGSSTVAGVQANGVSKNPRLSNSGRYLVFESLATNLTAANANTWSDIFVKDLTTGAVRIARSSTNAQGIEADQPAVSPAVSAGGQYIAFASAARNLVSLDTNQVADVFVTSNSIFQKLPLRIARVSQQTASSQGSSPASAPLATGTAGKSGLWGMAISLSGRFISFTSDAQNLDPNRTCSGHVTYVRDLTTGATYCLVGNGGDETHPAISADGRLTTFTADLLSLTSEPKCAGTSRYHIYLKNIASGELSCVSINSQGVRGNNHSDSNVTSVSADGRFVAFTSLATNLALGDRNNKRDVMIKDRITGSVTSAGPGAYSLLSADGRFVAFLSDDFLEGIKIYDLSTGATTILGAGPVNALTPCFSMSADAQFVSFSRSVGDYTQVYIRDRTSGAERLVSSSPAGLPGNDRSYFAADDGPAYGACNPSISGDGRYVVFSSAADNLVPNDTNGSVDIFVKDVITGAVSRLSVNAQGVEGFDHSFGATISFDGETIAFGSFSDNLVAGDTELCDGVNCADVFVTPNPLTP